MRLRQLIDLYLSFSHFQRPGEVVNVAAVDRTALIGRIETVAFCKKCFEPALCARLLQASIPCPEAHLIERQQACALVMELALVLRLDFHVRSEDTRLNS